ncbi:outer membrane beta-barrel family protein [Rhodohalobacter sulfatireducens]|uniref:TonB-dependent receptor family protein n=1 Tax=Rhodohalobacter sulfatireducens TaxID=2911366 RepID=A0ABS9KFK2_9BACT|nr:outer membrane beta-barrel family protein [Rhodohalobacter sulfatireducens]MCG2589567.1 TonB-dependent receptor family protein [Rhodohalobacter sulfatireducens]
MSHFHHILNSANKPLEFILLTILGSCFILLGLVFDAEAQVSVTGIVTDELENSVPAANVLLLNSADSTLVKGNITNETGHYEFQQIMPGSYLLSVSIIGYQPQITEPFDVNNAPVLTDTIMLYTSLEEMDEISVSAQRPFFEKKIDRLVVNVQQSITSSGNSALELLEKSPGIQVNRQSGSISMSGKAGVRVMINDKIVRLPVDAVLQMLDGMSAANIEQIELISTPPARYEAEGNAGLINIVMIERQDLGSNGTIGTNLAYNAAETLGGNLNYNYRGRKLAYFLNYSINYDRTEQNILNNRFLVQNSFTEQIREDQKREPTTNVQNARMGLEYSIGSKTTAGVLVSGYRRHWDQQALSNNFNNLGPDSTLIFDMGIRERNIWRNGMINASIDHSFNENQNLSFDFDYLHYINENPSVYQNEFIEGDRSLYQAGGIDVEKETPINIWVGRVDYTFQPSSTFSIETGVKGTLSEFVNDVSVKNNFDGSWEIDDRFTSDANLSENIGAAYLSGSWKPSEQLQMNAGLRYEYTDSYLSSTDEKGLIDREYGKFFPTVFISKDLSDDNRIGFSYNRRITRPTFNDMAPFVFFMSPRTFLSGTPSLQPAISDGVTMDLQLRSLLISLQYTHTKDEIGAFQPEVNSESNELTYTAKNLDYLRTYAATLSYQVFPTSWWQVQSNLSGRYQLFQTAHLQNNISDEIFGLNINITNTITLPKEFAFEVSGYYNSKSVWGIMQFRPQGSLNIGVQKKVGDGRGTLRLSANDILYTDVWKVDSDVPSANLDSSMRLDWHRQQISLTFSWNFGNNSLRAVNVDSGSEEEQNRVN